jgi:hypothetical protein
VLDNSDERINLTNSVIQPSWSEFEIHEDKVNGDTSKDEEKTEK